jgi:hypothetical protein
MKKAIATVLTMGLAISMVACGNKTAEVADQATEAVSEAAEAVEETAEAAAETEAPAEE